MDNLVNAEEKDIVITTIRKFLPRAAIKVFGSRIRGNAHKYSDLDVAINSQHIIDLAIMAQISDELAETNIPYTIDLIDYNRVSVDFQQHIDKNSVQW